VTEQTTDQILEETNAEVGRITSELEDLKGGAREVYGTEDVPPDELMDAIDAGYDKGDREYAAVIDESIRKIAEHGSKQQAKLWGAPQEPAAAAAYTNAVIQANAADDDQLRRLAELATQNGDLILTKAVFAEAVQRGRAEIGIPILEAHPEMREAFAELAATTPALAQLERSRGFKFPRPGWDTLKPTAEQVRAANRAQAVRRYENASRAANSW